MSENIRQFVNVYTQVAKTPYVYRPNSMRRVNAAKELNRLQTRIIKLENFTKKL